MTPKPWENASSRKTGELVPSGLALEIETCITQWRQLAQVRIVPALAGYMIEVVYEQPEEQAEVDRNWSLRSILGVIISWRLSPVTNPVLFPV